MKDIEFIRPGDIEKRSFEIIADELAKMNIVLPKDQDSFTRRAIHTSADFDYAKTLVYSENATAILKELLHSGATVVTDTNMALNGINRKIIEGFGGNVCCFMADADVAKEARQRGVTRATVSMERAAELSGEIVFAIGNAPTALIRLHELMETNKYRPDFIIGVPVGFVNIEAAKELFIGSDVPHIINRGRKGGSTIAAALVNAALYELVPR